jgi:hypothetical protein
MLKYLIPLALLPGAMAAPELLAIGAFNQGMTGSFFHGGWWYIALYAFIMWVTIGSALKRGLPQQEILAFLRDTGAATMVAALTAHFARWLFCLPQLLELNWVYTAYFDRTDDVTHAKLEENRRARKNCQPVPHPCIHRNLVPQTYSYWAGPAFTLGAAIVVHAVYIFRSSFDDVYSNPTAIAVTLTVIGGLMVLAGIVDMFLRPAPWSHLRNNQQTLKYVLAAILIFVLPTFYDNVLPGGPLVRAAITVGIYGAGWALFYFWSVYAWPDNIFFGREYHARWFAILGFLPNILGFIAGGIANDQYPGDSFIALLSQVIAAAVTIVFYILFYFTAYQGFSCCTVNKTQ